VVFGGQKYVGSFLLEPKGITVTYQQCCLYARRSPTASPRQTAERLLRQLLMERTERRADVQFGAPLNAAQRSD
jgi:hypothetical protein